MSKTQVVLKTKVPEQQQQFDTGSRRGSREGKGRYDLLSPFAERRLALVCERGAQAYHQRNWELGQPLCRYLDSSMRHINQYRTGERDEDHLAQAFWNLMAAIHTEEMILRGRLPEELNDLPDYTPIEKPEEEPKKRS
jgi:hypothetical protein